MRNDPVLITGAARSGTSMSTGIIHYCGAFGGEMTGPTPHNKKGQFENNYVRDHITKPYLRMIGVDPLCQRPLPDVRKLLPYPGLFTDVKTAMIHQGYKEGSWFYKGAKMCLLWPLWHKAFPNAKWIIVRRDPVEIAESCMRTSFMRAYKTVDGWLGWVAEHEKRFKEMKEAGLNITEVWSRDLIKGDLDVMKGFVDATVGLTWREDKIKDFITPGLWKEGKE